MAQNIFEQYGIKEVCDVTFYNIGETGEPTSPVLFLDSLKVSNLVTEAEEAKAQGGQGNADLIAWDHSKTGTFTATDALFSMASLAVLTGSKAMSTGTAGTISHGGMAIALKTVTTGPVTGNAFTGNAAAEVDGKTVDGRVIPAAAKVTVYGPGDTIVTAVTKDERYPITWEEAVSGGKITIDINTEKFPGTYYVTGDSWVRNKITGKDKFFRVILPKAKLQSNLSLTMEAGGDPSTFDLTLKLLKGLGENLVQIEQYDTEKK